MANYESFAAFELALKRAKEGLNEEVEVILKDEAHNLANAISMRVSTKGEKADGGNFTTPYSKSHTYKRKKDGSGSLGQQTNYVGFFYKGTMWNSFGLKEIKADGMKVVASIGFQGENLYMTNEAVAKEQEKRDNIHIGAANKEEATDLTRKIGLRIGQYLNSVL